MALTLTEVNHYRIRTGEYGSDDSLVGHGAFEIPLKDKKKVRNVFVIVSNSAGWEHVSVSFPDKIPSWNIMCQIKELFWEEEDVVVQYHPKKSEYINCHPYCLHLWRCLGRDIPTPPTWMIA